ncbi:MAG: WXG100 family type VII secretion target [Synergistaceae bacterium]|nr:WXG100 family type VII secretion target [Synergistaceae bacterium]MBQ6737345.1 WXG100 family type VII secretion target [Synergistaceae bacterium]MBQ7068839.1 WXG100 family type VII secretion target [Synergistaceae bacterium]MBR0079104.1 WXG100 family type VII secretion target [Synergistaceae bacterium]MBR0234825.1 WXG100 family type VII secretion target [Synergistaceae bacterium]
MAADILLTPENLLSEASNLLGNKSNLDSIFSQIANLIASLVEHWHGEAQKAFSDSFQQKRTVFDKFSQDMESFAKFMQKYANEMQQLETNQKNLAGKLGG